MAARLSRRLFAVSIAACIALTAQKAETYRVRLTPVSMDAAMRVNIAGSGSASAVLNGNRLSINGTFDGLLSPATSGQIHGGSATGVRGPAILELKVSPAKTGTVSGAFDLTADRVESLRKGRLY